MSGGVASLVRVIADLLTAQGYSVSSGQNWLDVDFKGRMYSVHVLNLLRARYQAALEPDDRLRKKPTKEEFLREMVHLYQRTYENPDEED